jgi:hypothetical protein
MKMQERRSGKRGRGLGLNKNILMKRNIQLLLLVTLLFQKVSAQNYSYKPYYSTILNKSKSGIGQHSRDFPKISGQFNPSKKVIKQLENNFKKILQLVSDSCCNANKKIENLGRFAFQYFGVIVDGKKYVYINAFRLSSDKKIGKHFTDWKKKIVLVFDGGMSFWGALYDIQLYEFSRLAFNGPPLEN